jgi:hypothetical protein
MGDSILRWAKNKVAHGRLYCTIKSPMGGLIVGDFILAHRPLAAILDFLEILKIAAYSPCGSEVAHQFSKRSVKGFKSYEILKNPRWPPACGRHLGFLKFEICG